MINISKYLESIYKKNADGIFLSKNSEDFSSSNKNSDSEFIESLIENDCRTAIKLFMPNLEEMIFSSKIEASLELFNHNKPGICIDYGSGGELYLLEWQNVDIKLLLLIKKMSI